MKIYSEYNAALYIRLSKDDSLTENSSIISQQKMLRDYALENGYSMYREYIDDGFSGTNFNRPGFKKMIEDINANKVNMVITKDLSRLGRDYITAGQYTEIFFPAKGVRFIAINDGYDSTSTYTDLIPFKNILNELYARDISKKIRSAFTAHMRNGSCIAAFAPYGYQKDPMDKHHLIIDRQPARIIQDIFHMALSGNSPIEIAHSLSARHIAPPSEYRYSHNIMLDASNHVPDIKWSPSTIVKILHNIVYCGHMAQGKTAKVSIKSPLTINKAQNDWIIVYGTHEPIIDEETFHTVQGIISSRAHKKNKNFFNIFSGIAKCADCGHNMSSTGTRKKGSAATLTCGKYKLHGKEACSNHFINYNVLYDIVCSSLKEQLSINDADKENIIANVAKRHNSHEQAADSAFQLKRYRKRLHEIECIIRNMYDDNACGKLNADTMKNLLIHYEKEANSLKAKIDDIELSMRSNSTLKQTTEDSLAKLLYNILNVTELTPAILFRFIDRIEISQGHYEKTPDGTIKQQSIKIFYKFQTQPCSQLYLI